MYTCMNVRHYLHTLGVLHTCVQKNKQCLLVEVLHLPLFIKAICDNL